MSHRISLVGYILMIVAYFLVIGHYLGYYWSIAITCVTVIVVTVFVKLSNKDNNQNHSELQEPNTKIIEKQKASSQSIEIQAGEKVLSSESNNNVQTIHVPEEIPLSYSPISAENVISTLRNKELTDLQRRNFMEEHKGRVVRWDGIVLEIKPGSSEHWPTIMVFRLPSDDSSYPEYLTASFSNDYVKDLSYLKKGQKIVIQGNLSFIEIGHPSISLDNTQLVKC